MKVHYKKDGKSALEHINEIIKLLRGSRSLLQMARL